MMWSRIVRLNFQGWWQNPVALGRVSEKEGFLKAVVFERESEIICLD
jgi:hypothetical protein